MTSGPPIAGLRSHSLFTLFTRARPILFQIVSQVVALQAAVREIAEEVTAERVAALFRNRVAEHAARPGFGREAAGRDRHLLHGPRVDHQRGVVAAARVVHVVVGHAVHHERHLVAAAAVHGQRLVAFSACAADVLRAERDDDARHQHAEVLEAPAARQRIDHLARQRLALLHALGVDERALARNRDRLFEAADLQVDVDRRR